MAPAFAAFPESEHRDRLARARKALKAAGFDFCISVAPEHLFYFGGYECWVSVNAPQALLFSVDEGEPAIVLRDVDLSIARESSWIKNLNTYRLILEDPAALIAKLAKQMGLKTGGRIAVETQSYAITHAFGKSLEQALAPAKIEDATFLLGDLRVVKSPREMVYLREAARFANAGLAAARGAMKKGVTEIGVASALETAMREAGSDYWSIPTELSAGPRSAGGHATPRNRVVEPGELIHAEFSGVSSRYHSACLHTMSMGEPGKRARDIYRLGIESLQAGIAAIRVGVPVADVEEASLVPLRREGLEHTAMMRFGYGIGIAYPPIWLETLQIARGIDRRLEPDMVFVLHSCLELVDEKLGVIQGGTWALTGNGLEMLSGSGAIDLEVY
ncbi:MAG: M24 family metallopeptidase [Dongiaceae bacterium]